MSDIVTTDPRITDQIAANPVAATLTEEDGRWTLTMQRRLRHSPAKVWLLMTEPDQLARWSPIVPDRAFDSVGPATARENPGDDDAVDAEVLAVDPPRELVHRWRADVLRWTLEPAGGGTLLTVHHTFADRARTGSYGAGWHICLGALAALDAHGFDNEDAPRRVVGGVSLDYGWQDLHDAYAAALA